MAFGFGQQQQQPSTSLFSSNPAQPQQTSLFGQAGTTTNTTGGGGLFGSPAQTGFGQPANNQQGGTAIAKFQAPQETDTLMKGSTQSYVQTKQQCITFMREYAEKSLEELRFEDYAANRKGPQGGAGMFVPSQQTGVFGATAQQPQANSLFGGQQNNQQTTGLFGTAQNTLGGGKVHLNIARNLLIRFLFSINVWPNKHCFWTAKQRRTLREASSNASHNIDWLFSFRSEHFDVWRSKTFRTDSSSDHRSLRSESISF